MTHESPAVCKQIEDYLMAKISKDHAGVKYKVLRIIRFICENDGAPEFRRLIQRRAESIRQCQGFRGTADPLRGDAPNKAVREEAVATMKALFAVENTSGAMSSIVGQNGMNARIQGVGSSDFGYSQNPTALTTSVASTHHRSMNGVGNPYFPNTSGPSSTSSSLSGILQSESPAREIITAMTSGVQSVAQSLAKVANPYLPSALQQTTPPSSYSLSSESPFSKRNDWVPPKISASLEPHQTSVQTASDSDMRQALIDLCQSNPARSVPHQQALEIFVSKCQTFDGELVAKSLLAKLEDPSAQWTHRTKALVGIEAVHAAGLDGVSESIKQSPKALFALFASPQCGTKAKQVAALLGLIDGETGGHQSSVPVSPPPLIDDLIDIAPAVKSGDLLDFDDSNVSSPPPITEQETSLI
jgi:hypothetical protein